MSMTNIAKRTFFKKLAATAGFFSAASYLGNLISAKADLPDRVNENCARDVEKQKNVIAQAQLVLMTDGEKKRMLDEMQMLDKLFGVYEKI